MLSTISSVFKNFFATKDYSRKRQRDTRLNGDDEEYSNLEFSESLKRRKLESQSAMEQNNTEDTFVAPKQPLWGKMTGGLADWVAKPNKTSFNDIYYVKSKPNEADNPKPGTSKEFNKDFEKCTNGTSLIRRPLHKTKVPKAFSVLKRSENEPQVVGLADDASKSNPSKVNGEMESKSSGRGNFAKNKHSPINYESYSNRHSPKTVYDRLFTSKTRLNHISNHSKPSQWKGWTAKQSIKLDEKEEYRQLLKQYANMQPSPSFPVRSVKDLINLKKPYPSSSLRLSELPNKSPFVLEKLHPSFADSLKFRCSTNAPSSSKHVKSHQTPLLIDLTLENFKTTNEKKGVKQDVVTHDDSVEILGRNLSKREKNFSDIKVVPQATKPVEEQSEPVEKSHFKLHQNWKSLEDVSQYINNGWVDNFKKKLEIKNQETESKIEIETRKLKEAKRQTEEYRRSVEKTIELKFKNVPIIIEDFEIVEDEEEEEEEKYPELTSDMVDKIESALKPSPAAEVLVNAFNLPIARQDMVTLDCCNWLNDSIINFYMSLLMERGKLDNYPSVYTCNTFFYPKLMSGGHASLKRWTRKVDIFAHDLFIVPVHLGVHWCLAVVHFKNKTICYYDSMGGKNNACLNAIKEYLQAESLDKKSTKLDMSDWVLTNVPNIPQQLNGGDCGVFACQYAEVLSRNSEITFTQELMPYFRKRMVYEILTKRLL